MNFYDYLILAAIAVAVIFAVRYLIRHRGTGGCSGCTGDCQSCRVGSKRKK